MTVYLIRLQPINNNGYDFIHTFDHVQLDTNVIAVDTDISPDELAKQFASYAKSIEIMIPGQVSNEFNLTMPAYKWLKKKGF